MPQNPKYQFSCAVVPQYIPQQSSPDDSIYGFAYTVTITKTGQVTAQLISRHWEIVDATRAIAAERGVPMAQIALAWLLSKPAVTAPIIGATKMYQLDEAIGAIDIVLSADEITRLEASYRPHAVKGHE